MTRGARGWRAVFLVAANAVSHLENPYLFNLSHTSHVAVAFSALKTGSDVRLVSELGVVGKSMLSYPIERLPGFPRGTQRLKVGICSGDSLMAEHALFHGWHSGRFVTWPRPVAESHSMGVSSRAGLVELHFVSGTE